jgi:hypothetical protein
MRLLLLIWMVLVSDISFAQLKALSNIPLTGETPFSFIPPSYDTLSMRSGDMNKDGIPDIAIVLKPSIENLTDSVFDPDSFPRIILVLIKEKDEYRLAAASASAILCANCGGIFGDPFSEIAVSKGLLVIDHNGGSNWRWEVTHKYRYQQNDMYLVGNTNRSYWNVQMCEKINEFAGTEYRDENLITGAFEEKKVSVDDCRLLVNKKGKIKPKPLKKISEVKIDN